MSSTPSAQAEGLPPLEVLSKGFDRLRHAASVVLRIPRHEAIGRVSGVSGAVLRVSGLEAALGHVVRIRSGPDERDLLAEVAGFSEGSTLVMPYGPVDGIGRDATVHAGKGRSRFPFGRGLLGCVLDPLGRVLHGELGADCAWKEVHQEVPDPFERLSIERQLPTGVASLDALVPLGVGQRMGIFASAGSGKTTLMGMLARGCAADVIVIGLIGERGREVRDFIEGNLGDEGLQRSVVIAATSDRSALERIRCAFVATAVADDFRRQGLNVLLLMDSLTRFARAQREIGLALGEPPTRRGYPPSLFALLPQLVERPGRTRQGSVSFYTVLMEDDASPDPVAEEVKSLLDGHIHLSPKISQRGILPAIDISASLSRLQSTLLDPDQLAKAAALRKHWNAYLGAELLIQIGEYNPGSDPSVDEAVRLYPAIVQFLGQDERQLFDVGQARARLATALGAWGGR
jgi:type III secretion protein N (ATPase)